ncbi:hypothetical protein KJ632_00765 [Patescibacteria group bacterium]|nr:hypothetical protein [Patescibacteria group bacterium]
MITLVVTRHKALLQYLKEIGIVGEEVEAKEHVSPEEIRGKHVCGVLPHHLSSLCTFYTEIPLIIPQEFRGKELTLEEIREYCGKPQTYCVVPIEE